MARHMRYANIGVVPQMTGSADFAPHFHPSVAEVKSMKKELVVK
jgi:hypothetical protein